MTDAYRRAPFTCPACGFGLREYDHRLICDDCSGMLLSEADFAHSIHELDGGTDPLVATDGPTGTAACPRCQAALRTCSLVIGALTLSGQFLRCETDGVWVPRDAMTAAFARASRAGGKRGVGGARIDSGMGFGGGVSGMNQAIAAVDSAFSRSSTGGLRISGWGSSRPRVHTLFVSAHQDRQLACPTCADRPLHFAGDRWDCASCAGTFVEDAALAAMVSEITAQPWEVPAISGTPGERACPACRVAMVVETRDGVTVDRCAEHGTWFDDTELQAVLAHEGQAASPGGWLKKLFHRHA